MKAKLIAVLVAFLFFGIFIFVLLAYLAQHQGTIHLALAAPMTGEQAAEGQALKHGVELYLNEVNRRGGVQGKRLVLDVYDDQNDEERAVRIARQIVEHSRALGVIGHFGSSCAMRAGAEYMLAEIPAITPTATSITVTRNNPWYFRTVLNDQLQARFHANYAVNVLQHSTVSTIFEFQTEGFALAAEFESTAKELGAEVTYHRGISAEDQNLTARFQEIVAELQTKQDAGALFLAIRPTEGATFVKLFKEAGLTNTLLAPSSFAGHSFPEQFQEYPREQDFPGFYTQDIYVTSPLLFDTANDRAQQFRAAYTDRYGKQPDWRSAYAYDTAMLLGEAINATEIQGRPDTLTQDRLALQDFLAGLLSSDQAIEGVTGLNYFDASGDAQKPMSFGVYRQNNVVSTLTQFQQVSEADQLSELNEALEHGRIQRINGQYVHQTNVAYTGLKIREMSELNVKEGTCVLDFHLWFRFQKGIKADQIVFLNAVEPLKLELPLKEEVKGQILYRLYHVRGRFSTNFLEKQREFGSHNVGVSFRHQERPITNLMYIIDSMGMGSSDQASLTQQLLRDRVLSLGAGGRIIRFRIFQDTAQPGALEALEFAGTARQAPAYSRFNASILIKEEALTLRGLLPGRLGIYVMILSLAALLLIFLVKRRTMPQDYPKTLCIIQTVLFLLLLVAVEAFVVNTWWDTLTRYYQHSVTLLFDILWWVIPAILITMAIECFIWKPLEQRTERSVPNIIRHIVASIVYLLAFFGIVAYVFDQRLTGLLATSGVVAMVIGLAIQINITNVFSGIAINLEQPFRVGDWIKIDDYLEGQVINITWRTTRIKTWDECVLCIPNSVASESSVYNYHYPSEVYWSWPTVHVDPAHSPDRVKKILLDAVLSAEGVVKDPPPYITFLGLTNWSADYWVGYAAQNYEHKFEHAEAVWKRVWMHLNRAGITPATRRQELHVFRGKEERGQEATRPLTLLREIYIFNPFSEEEKTALSRTMRRQHYLPNEIIIQQGDEGDSVFIIIEGTVSVRVKLQDGANLEVDRMGAGEFFGEIALLTGGMRTASIIALTEVLLYEIKKADIAPFIEAKPELVEALSDELTRRTMNKDTKKQSQEQEQLDEQALSHQFFQKISAFFGVLKK